MSARTIWTTDDGLTYSRPDEMSDTLELRNASGDLVGVVHRTYDCTGDLDVRTVRNACEISVDRTPGTDYAAASALVAQNHRDADADETVPASALEGHELRDVTTDRARSVGSLRTVACTCTRTQYTADGIGDAVALHDNERIGAIRRAATRAREEYRNALVLASRYGSDAGRVEAVEELRKLDAADEILPPSDDVDDVEELSAAERISRTVELHGTRGKLWDGVNDPQTYSPDDESYADWQARLYRHSS